MQTVAASLLLVYIMLVCPTLPTLVSTMTRDSPKLESVSLAQRIQTETLNPQLSRAARSVQAKEDLQMVSAVLIVDGKVCLNFTKKAEAIRLGDSNDIFKADFGNTEIVLSMKVTKKDRAPPPPPPPTPRPTVRVTPTTATANHCTDGYCLFGGTCVYYNAVNKKLCNCRRGYRGIRCELYNVDEVLSDLDSENKRSVIGNGPIVQQGDHMDVLSVLESMESAENGPIVQQGDHMDVLSVVEAIDKANSATGRSHA